MRKTVQDYMMEEVQLGEDDVLRERDPVSWIFSFGEQQRYLAPSASTLLARNDTGLNLISIAYLAWVLNHLFDDNMGDDPKCDAI